MGEGSLIDLHSSQLTLATEHPQFEDAVPIGKGGFPFPCSRYGRVGFWFLQLT